MLSPRAAPPPKYCAAAAAAAAACSFHGVKQGRGRTKESITGGIILVNTVRKILGICSILYRYVLVVAMPMYQG